MHTNLNQTHQANFIFKLSDNKLNTFEFFINEFSGLGLTLNEAPGQFWQGIGIKRPGDFLTFNDISLQVIVDEDYEVLVEIINYFNAVRSLDPNKLDWNHNFTGTLFATTNKNNFKKKFNFFNCWIKDMSDFTFSTNQTDDVPIILSVTMAFDYYTISRL